ncbi:membrane hypothetical protein [Nitrospina gracilis 3/211]|uniref:Uncharacterized protein n=1 Tax=Nitrospina gracilis (strain 3/211) TaxID=1266370 RepID=M1YZX8_NITG3|nr:MULTISPECIES: hypothetical protein [Nitrospina]MCF8724131.1 hypothetical protein [Nitrospina sp. Nb-3]CCQ91277.1 membrane hypothetical protein [Nitrospina gracilis 3/211]
MDRTQLVTYWRNFFSDLLVGTFKSLFLFATAGMFLAALAGWGLDTWFLDPTGLSMGLQWLILILALGWLLPLGMFHGLVASALATVGKKLKEAVNGLHDLLDILVKGVFSYYPNLSKNISKKELGEKFDQIGHKFMEDLKLKGGPISYIKGLIFRIILKALKFFFLDDMMEEISKKPGEEVTRADIESAVRRVGVEFLLSTIHDNIMILQAANAIVMLLLFSLPFGILAFF